MDRNMKDKLINFEISMVKELYMINSMKLFIVARGVKEYFMVTVHYMDKNS